MCRRSFIFEPLTAGTCPGCCPSLPFSFSSVLRHEKICSPGRWGRRSYAGCLQQAEMPRLFGYQGRQPRVVADYGECGSPGGAAVAGRCALREPAFPAGRGRLFWFGWAASFCGCPAGSAGVRPQGAQCRSTSGPLKPGRWRRTGQRRGRENQRLRCGPRRCRGCRGGRRLPCRAGGRRPCSTGRG